MYFAKFLGNLFYRTPLGDCFYLFILCQACIRKRHISYNLSCLKTFTIFLLFSTVFTIATWFVLEIKKKTEIRQFDKNQTKQMFSNLRGFIRGAGEKCFYHK